MPELPAFLERLNDYDQGEDAIYRFYHGSFKVYYLQGMTKRIVEALHKIAPTGTSFCALFEEIYQEGASGKEFDMDHNDQWSLHTRPFIEAYFHARYFLDMAVTYGNELTTASPRPLPSGWAALLCLYDLR